MRREDVFMDIIGEIDDKYIAMAMPRASRSNIAADAGSAAVVQSAEAGGEVSKKDIRMYYVTRALGMAAVTVLVLCAVLLLWKNWDKIASRDPETPPVVTTDPTSVTSDSTTSDDIPPIIDRTEAGYVDAADWGITMEALSADSDGVNIEIRQSGGSFTGQIKYSYGFTVEKYTDGEWVHEISQLGDYWEYELAPGGTNREYRTYGKKLDAGKYRLVQNFVDLRAPGDFDIASGYAEFEIPETNAADRFEQITDTSMPEPFSKIRDLEKFDLQWTARLYNIPDGFYRDGIAEWENSVRSNETPYTLYDNYNLANYIKTFGITADEIEEKLREHNEYWQEDLDEAEKNGNERSERTAEYIRHFIYTDEEINTLKSGDEAAIAELFISDNSILLKEQNNVISPMWLYYHTVGEYNAVGLTPDMVREKYPLYEQDFSGGDYEMTDEAWAAFDAKLKKYMSMTTSISEDADRFEQITDTSMPDLITGYYDDDSYFNFEFPWKLELRSIPIELMRLVDESETDKWFESVNTLNSGTPYRINRGYSLYSYVTGVGLSWEEAAPILERDFSADEISAMVSGDKYKMTAAFASEYTIVVGDCAYSPMWLYYHTAEDYEAAGIISDLIGEKIKKYESLGLPDEMWRAFRTKLTEYMYYHSEAKNGSVEEYWFETDQTEPFGDRAFEILEDRFYGVWELADAGEHDILTDLSFTYSKDIFKHDGTPVSGIFENDEIYVITYSNFGVLDSYVIKKSEPDVMYEAEIVGYNVGINAAKLTAFDLKSRKYINRKAAVPGLKSGELSVLGQKKLLHTYGKAFEDSFNAAFEKDKSEGIETGMGTAYSTSKDIYSFGYPPRYLADFTDDTVNMLLPYYYEKDGSHTVIYAVKSFSRNYKGEWDAVNIWTDEGIAPLFGIGEASGSTIPVGMLGEFDLDALTDKVFSGNGTLISGLNKFLDSFSDKELAAQYRKAFALGTSGCRDMEDYENAEVLRRYYGDDYESSGKRAVIYIDPGTGTDDTSGTGWANAVSDQLDSILSDGSGNILGKSSGYSFVSVMNAYLRTFSSSYINDVFPQLPFVRCGNELFCRDASAVIPDCHYEFGYNGDDNRVVTVVMGYAKDKETGEKTDEVIFGIEAIFDKTSEGWKCSRFNLRKKAQ